MARALVAFAKPKVTCPLIRAAYCSFLTKARPRSDTPNDPQEIARTLYKHLPEVARLFDPKTRAAVAPASTSSDAWGSASAGEAWGEFLESLAPMSAMATVISRGLSVTLASATQRFLVRSTAPAAAPWVEEGDAISVKAFGSTAVTVGPARNAGIISLFTRELALRAGASAIFRTQLLEDAAATMDAAYLSSDVGSDSAHQGLLYGLASLIPAWDDGTTGMRQDLANLGAAVSATGSGEVAYIAHPSRTAKMAVLDPSQTVSILPSLAVPIDRLIGIDPRAIVHAATVPEVDASTEATLHRDDAAGEIVDAGGVVANPVTSLFQQDLIAVRLLVALAWAARTSTPVAFVDGCNW